MVSNWFFSAFDQLLNTGKRGSLLSIFALLIVLVLTLLPQLEAFACSSGTGSCPCPGC